MDPETTDDDPFWRAPRFAERLAENIGADRASDCLQFIEVASILLKDREMANRRGANLVAYALRCALDDLLPADSRAGEWKLMTKELVEAKIRLDSVVATGSESPEALTEVLKAVDSIREYKESTQDLAGRRADAFLSSRPGITPLGGVQTWVQRLWKDLNKAVHSRPSMEYARQWFTQVCGLLRMQYSPPEHRQPELDRLAAIPTPTQDDVDELKIVAGTHQWLLYFAQRATSAAWLQLLTDSGLVVPEQGIWPVNVLIERLKEDSPEAVVEWLRATYASFGRDERGAYFVVQGASLCLPQAGILLPSIAKEHSDSDAVRTSVVLALEDLDWKSEVIEEVSTSLLRGCLRRRAGNVSEAQALIRALVSGVTTENVLTRTHITARALSDAFDELSVFRFMSGAGSLGQFGGEEDSVEHAAVSGLLQLVASCFERGRTVVDVLDVLDALPTPLRSRFRAYTVAKFSDDVDVMIAELVNAWHRVPTGDDVALVRRIQDKTGLDSLTSQCSDVFGPPPSPADVAFEMGTGAELTPELKRVHAWFRLLPTKVQGEWRSVVSLLENVWGETRSWDQLDAPMLPIPEFGFVSSPLNEDLLQSMSPPEAAEEIRLWRPSSAAWDSRRYALANALERVVSASPKSWSERPTEIVSALHEPLFIHHYFSGLAQSAAELAGRGERLVEAATVTRARPWDPDQEAGGFENGWDAVNESSVRLIRSLADADVSLGDQVEHAWNLVRASARDRSQSSHILSPTDDVMSSAINRPCTKALEAAFSMAGASFRSSGTLSDGFVELLDEALLLPGRDGEEHRAIIAARLAFLRHTAAEWLESRRDLLFGSGAPGNLGQRTVELALRWGQPMDWFLQEEESRVRESVRTEAERSMTQYIIAMLRGLRGYSIAAVVDSLVSMGPNLVSSAGEQVARLLMRGEVQEEHLERGVAFWSAMLERDPLGPAAWSGFGWWAEVETLAQGRWEQLMLRTLERAGGSIDWATGVAERCTNSANGLLILRATLRGNIRIWDRPRVARIAFKLLSEGAPTDDPLYESARQRLNDTLAELGFHSN